MSPTIDVVGPYRFYFNSNEETRMHIHVRGNDGKAKFWLEPIVALADYKGLRTDQLNELQKMIEDRKEKFKHAWRKHFSVR